MSYHVHIKGDGSSITMHFVSGSHEHKRHLTYTINQTSSRKWQLRSANGTVVKEFGSVGKMKVLRGALHAVEAEMKPKKPTLISAALAVAG